jgi:hypothetical protein
VTSDKEKFNCVLCIFLFFKMINDAVSLTLVHRVKFYSSDPGLAL